MRGNCERCGKRSDALRKLIHKKKDYGYICKRCRKAISPDLTFNLKIY